MKQSQENFVGGLFSKPKGKVGIKGILKGKAASASSAEYLLKGMKLPNLVGNSDGTDQSKLQNEIINLKNQLTKKNNELSAIEKRLQQEKTTEIDQAQQASFRKGQKIGYTKATEEYDASMQLIEQNVENFLNSFNKSKSSFYQEVEIGSIQLLQTITKKIFYQSINEQDEFCLKVVTEAMKFLGRDKNIKVHVCANDFTILNGKKDFWQPIQSCLENIDIIKDNRITRGGCFIETESGTIDMQSETIIKKITSLLDNVIDDIAGVPPKEEGTDDVAV